jgi:hypothetical protein
MGNCRNSTRVIYAIMASLFLLAFPSVAQYQPQLVIVQDIMRSIIRLLFRFQRRYELTKVGRLIFSNLSVLIGWSMSLPDSGNL